MNCTDIADYMTSLAEGTLPADQHSACMAHIELCDECADALHGALALRELRKQDMRLPPAGLFERIGYDAGPAGKAGGCRTEGRRILCLCRGIPPHAPGDRDRTGLARS